jgi:membrane protein
VARQALTLGLTFGGGAMVIAAFVLIVIGERLSDWIAEETGYHSSLIDLLVSGNLGSALLVFIATAALYWLAPAAPNSGRWVLPGTVLVTLATLVVFVSFDFLVRLVDPGSAFGAAGSILVLLWLLYLESAFVVAGAIVNAVLSHRYDARLIDFLHDHPERRLPPQR